MEPLTLRPNLEAPSLKPYVRKSENKPGGPKPEALNLLILSPKGEALRPPKPLSPYAP